MAKLIESFHLNMRDYLCRTLGCLRSLLRIASLHCWATLIWVKITLNRMLHWGWVELEENSLYIMWLLRLWWPLQSPFEPWLCYHKGHCSSGAQDLNTRVTSRPTQWDPWYLTAGYDGKRRKINFRSAYRRLSRTSLQIAEWTLTVECLENS